MSSMGNNCSNLIYEHKLEEGIKPLANDSQDIKEKFILAKYSQLLYADVSKVKRSDPSSDSSFEKKIRTLYKSGFLTKQGNTVKSWKRRWFVLKLSDSSALLYYFRNRGVCFFYYLNYYIHHYYSLYYYYYLLNYYYC